MVDTEVVNEVKLSDYEVFKKEIESLEREKWDNGWTRDYTKAQTQLLYMRFNRSLDKYIQGKKLMNDPNVSIELSNVLLDAPYTQHLMQSFPYLDEKEGVMKQSKPFWDRFKNDGDIGSPKDYLRLEWIASAWQQYEDLQDILGSIGGELF